ncbi:MAG TPA: glycosyltransferase family 39 protein [bacterium]|jgi:4-amino-4-deoxy-L-arabinose transferase-like glycosyltransferase
MRFTDSSRAIWWIVGIALALRLAAIPLLGSDPSNLILFEYGRIAWNIVQGHGFSFDFYGRFPLQPTAYSPALYCYSLVPWFALFGINFLGPRLMHAVFLAAVAWFLYKIGERQVNRRVGLIAAAIWALYPEMIFLGLRMAPENLMFPLMMAMLWLVQTPKEDAFGRTAFAGGALTGLTAWANPSSQLLGIVVPVHWWLNGHLRGRQGLKRLALYAAGGILVIAPWTVRNYIKLGAFVPLRTAFALNMWRGNHIGATGTCRNFDYTNVDETLPKEYADYVEAHLLPDEIARDRFFAAEVKQFISEHPGQYLKLSLTRFFYYWWRDPTHPLTGSIWFMGPWILLMTLAAIGFYSQRKALRKWWLWLLQIMGFTVLFSLTIVVPRYRMPMLPALMLLAAAGVNHLMTTRTKTQTSG